MGTKEWARPIYGRAHFRSSCYGTWARVSGVPAVLCACTETCAIWSRGTAVAAVSVSGCGWAAVPQPLSPTYQSDTDWVLPSVLVITSWHTRGPVMLVTSK